MAGQTNKGGPKTIAYTEELTEGRTFSIGSEVESVLGYSLNQWMTDPMLWVKLLHPDDREDVVQACDAANQTMEPFHAEYRMIARDGRVIRIHDDAAIVYSARGEPLCWQGVMTVLA